MDPEKPKIEILWDIPIVFTRNQKFADYVHEHGPFKPGDVVLLPDDAVLAKLPLPQQGASTPTTGATKLANPVAHMTDDEQVIT